MGFFDRGKKKKRLEEAGVTAPAQLISVQDTGVTVNNNPRVKLTLAVSPTDGSPPFEVSAKHTVSRVAVPRAGDVFTVRYDPQDHENFAFEAGGSSASSLRPGRRSETRIRPPRTPAIRSTSSRWSSRSREGRRSRQSASTACPPARRAS
jgi:hypothetical protein